MKANPLNDLRRIVTLFAGFVIGMHVAVLLHEFGHALGFWCSGGTVSRIVMQSPLPAGHVEGHGPNDRAILWVWGGVVFGALIAIIPLTVARCHRRWSLLRFAMMMVAAFCLAHNGMYLFIGSMIPFSDASNMIALGAPRWLLFAFGVPLIVGFVVVLTAAILMVDLSPARPVLIWIITVELGLLTLPAVMVASMFFMPVPSSVRSPTIAFVSCYAVCFCIAAYRAHAASISCDPESQRNTLNHRWSTPGALMLAAVVLVFVEWLAFGTA